MKLDKLPPIKIVSGGQTGVDRAGLDAAMMLGIDVGGWCPKGRLAEDGRIAPEYPLTETTSSKYSVRTQKNVIDSDGTLILAYGKLTGGTALTAVYAHQHTKPLFRLDLSQSYSNESIINWIKQNQITVLNIAGPRESTTSGIYTTTKTILVSLFSELQKKWATSQMNN